MKAEQSLFADDSITKRLHSDPSMAVGGIRALLQQALHPVAMAGVANNSNFREDTWGRLRRTGDYVALLTFGPIAQAEAMATRVRAIHSKLGLDDPHLLLWVHMAMVDSFLDVAVRSGLALEPKERDSYVLEMLTFAKLVGIKSDSVPTTVLEMQTYFAEISPELVASEDAKRAAIFLTFPPMSKSLRFGTPAAPAWTSLAALASAALPVWARKLYNLPNLPGHELATNIALRATRSTLGLIPESVFV